MKKLTDFLVEDNELNNIKNSKYRNIINVGNKSMISFQNEIEGKSNKVEIKIFSNLKSGTIDLVSLDQIISGLQKIYTYSLNYKIGNTALKGKISQKVKEQSKLILNNTYAGSYILELERNPESQIDMNDVENNDFNIFDEVFKTSDDFNPETNIKNLGYRTFKTIREWYKELDEDKLEIAYKNRDSQKEIIMDNKTIQNLNSKLGKVKEIETKTNIQKDGKIIYVDHKNSVINFQTSDEIYKIHVLGDSFRNINIKTNKKFNLSFKEILYEVSDIEISKKYECYINNIEYDEN
ncbi:hypothetical protein [Staphylococcus aureus]|uniref:hypothetical protein n=1 Tax=Staphylococcus aureus TaxID=1280 RepID=UPI00118C120E|nr:hypothetical protein [Staphylococcus aureus]MDW3896868.1 hypothetical protein [Staphylococcus saprophyticus]QDS45629.1 hypothetical protein FP477_00090 [Staphylococcus aureus]